MAYKITLSPAGTRVCWFTPQHGEPFSISLTAIAPQASEMFCHNLDVQLDALAHSAFNSGKGSIRHDLRKLLGV